ncbi:rplT [Symbiodinium sp. KB8]|nr:rplT [Symbiodinium sp. KB8]
MQLKHKKIRALAKGYFLRNKNVFRTALNRVNKAAEHAYVGRKLKKRDMRKLWITQVNAGLQQHGFRYSDFIHSAALSDVALNRKVLAQLAITEPYSFKAVVETVRATGHSLKASLPKRVAMKKDAPRGRAKRYSAIVQRAEQAAATAASASGSPAPAAER